MSVLSAAFMLLAFVQVPGEREPDLRVNAIAPFVETDVMFVVQVDLTRADLPGLASRLFDEKPPDPILDVKGSLHVFDALRRAGANELNLFYSVNDIPGLPFAVIPLGEGTDGAEIGRLLRGGAPAVATVHNAVFAGTSAALERVRLAPSPTLRALASRSLSTPKPPPLSSIPHRGRSGNAPFTARALKMKSRSALQSTTNWRIPRRIRFRLPFAAIRRARRS